MDLTPLIPQGRLIINGYGAGGFKLGGVEQAGSVLVLPDKFVPWPVKSMTELRPEHLKPVMQASPAVELLLLGCGMQMEAIPAEIKQFLRGHQIALEAMDTGAACRTYNVLVGEERRVAAALIAV